MPPKLVPTSIPASARAKRALPSKAVMAIRSPDQLNIRLAEKVGISAAATQVEAKTKYGATRNSQEALSATTASLPSSRRRSRYGWISDGAAAALQPGLHLAHQADQQRRQQPGSAVICTSCASSG